MRVRISPDDIDDMVKASKHGEQNAVIAKRFNITPAHVGRLIRRRGVIPVRRLQELERVDCDESLGELAYDLIKSNASDDEVQRFATKNNLIVAQVYGCVRGHERRLRNDAIYRAYINGESPKDLAAMHNISPQAIYSIISKMSGFTKTTRVRRKESQAEIETRELRYRLAAAEYATTTKTCRQIARKFNMTVNKLFETVRELGYPMRGIGNHLRKSKVYDEPAIIKDYLDSDLTYCEIAKKYTMNVATLAKIIERNNVPRRGRGRRPGKHKG